MKMTENRWFVFSFAMWMCLVSGAAYSFGSYSHKFKEALSWPQHDIELMGELLNVGMCLGPIIGSLVDTFTARVTFIISLLTCFVGYFVVGILVSAQSSLPPIIYGIFMLSAGFGAGLGYNTALAVAVHNFKDSPYSARVIGLMSSMFGFSATVFSAFFNGFHMSASTSLQFMGITLAGTYLVGALTVKRLAPEMSHYSPLIPKEKISAISKVMNCFKTLFVQSSFWILLACFILGCGGGSMVINNVGHISKTLNNGLEDSDAIVLLVLTLSFCNGAGRVLMGLSDYLAVPRGAGLTLALGVMCLGQLCNAFIATSIPRMYLPVALVGIGYGMIWCIVPTLVSEIFDVDSFGQNFGTFQLGPAIAGVMFNSMAGKLYEMQTVGSEIDCIGQNCFHSSFICAASAAFLGCLLSLLLIRKTSVPHATVR